MFARGSTIDAIDNHVLYARSDAADVAGDDGSDVAPDCFADHGQLRGLAMVLVVRAVGIVERALEGELDGEENEVLWQVDSVVCHFAR